MGFVTINVLCHGVCNMCFSSACLHLHTYELADIHVSCHVQYLHVGEQAAVLFLQIGALRPPLVVELSQVVEKIS